MLEIIRSQEQVTGFHHTSQPACEISLFMKNFFEAVQDGNNEEVLTYYSDEMESFEAPLSAERDGETIIVDDHLATFSCLLKTEETQKRLTYVLDKSEGYWQIIYGELKSDTSIH